MNKLISSFCGGFIISYCSFKFEDFFIKNNLFLRTTAALAVICVIYCGCSLIFAKDEIKIKNIIAAVIGILFAALLL